MENSAQKTLRVSHSYHSHCYWSIYKGKTKTEEKKNPFSFFGMLDIHIAVDRAESIVSSIQGQRMIVNLIPLRFNDVAFKRVILPTLSDHDILDRMHVFSNNEYMLLRYQYLLKGIKNQTRQQNKDYDYDLAFEYMRDPKIKEASNVRINLRRARSIQHER